MMATFSSKGFFSPRFLVLVALLAAINTVAAGDARTCDDILIKVANQTDIDFYKTCPTISGTFFGIDHQFKGPFELPGVESVPEVSSGYLGRKLKGSDREDDGVTSVSMPDLKNITSHGLLLGFLEHLTSISFPKLQSIAGGMAIAGTDGLRKVSFPALSTVTGGMLLDGDFDEINFPSLKSITWLRVLSLGNLNCTALGASLASLAFKPEKYDMYSGFTCWTPDENNRWNSSDPKHNPTGGGSPTATSGSGSPTQNHPTISDSSATVTGSGPSSATSTKTGAANAPSVGYNCIVLILVLSVIVWPLLCTYLG